MLVSVRDDYCPGLLRVSGWDAQQEVQARIAGRESSTCIEREQPIIICEERIPDLKLTSSIAEFQTVFSLNPGQVIGKLIGLIFARLGSIVGAAKREVPSKLHLRVIGAR